MTNTDLVTQALRPCHWCAAPTEVVELSPQPPMWHVECTSFECCSVGPMRETKAEAISAWNTRSDPRYEELLKLAEGMADATSDLHHIGVCKARDAFRAFLQRQKDTEHG